MKYIIFLAAMSLCNISVSSADETPKIFNYPPEMKGIIYFYKHDQDKSWEIFAYDLFAKTFKTIDELDYQPRIGNPSISRNGKIFSAVSIAEGTASITKGLMMKRIPSGQVRVFDLPGEPPQGPVVLGNSAFIFVRSYKKAGTSEIPVGPYSLFSANIGTGETRNIVLPYGKEQSDNYTNLYIKYHDTEHVYFEYFSAMEGENGIHSYNILTKAFAHVEFPGYWESFDDRTIFWDVAAWPPKLWAISKSEEPGAFFCPVSPDEYPGRKELLWKVLPIAWNRSKLYSEFCDISPDGRYIAVTEIKQNKKIFKIFDVSKKHMCNIFEMLYDIDPTESFVYLGWVE